MNVVVRRILGLALGVAGLIVLILAARLFYACLFPQNPEDPSAGGAMLLAIMQALVACLMLGFAVALYVGRYFDWLRPF